MNGNGNSSFSRRQMVGALGGSLAVAAASPAHSQGEAQMNTAQPMVDPTTKYPKPPFAGQEQPWPGLASKMEPTPDHGETTYKGSGRLAGRKALITGGDSGMGRAAAIAFAREGADVAINYFPTEEPDAREVIDLIQKAGRKGAALPGDLRDQAFCVKLVEDALAALGDIDILVMNAGRQQSIASLTDVSDEEFDWTMKTNIYAPFYIIRAALPHLKPGSTIIATASEQAYDPSPDLYAYAQTKAATMNYVKSLAKQLAPKGIRVNGVAPGPIWTPLQVSGGASQEKLKNFGGTSSLGRPGQPAELASIYVHWHRRTRATPPVRSMAQPAVRVNRRSGCRTACIVFGKNPAKTKGQIMMMVRRNIIMIWPTRQTHSPRPTRKLNPPRALTAPNDFSIPSGLVASVSADAFARLMVRMSRSSLSRKANMPEFLNLYQSALRYTHASSRIRHCERSAAIQKQHCKVWIACASRSQ
jgi:NAD(P)-dependent dehydrogenase (short-subunit alcohol dehydrogenase family)